MCNLGGIVSIRDESWLVMVGIMTVPVKGGQAVFCLRKKRPSHQRQQEGGQPRQQRAYPDGGKSIRGGCKVSIPRFRSSKGNSGGGDGKTLPALGGGFNPCSSRRKRDEWLETKNVHKGGGAGVYGCRGEKPNYLNDKGKTQKALTIPKKSRPLARQKKVA